MILIVINCIKYWDLYRPMYVLGRVNISGHWRPYEMIYDDYDGQWYPGIDGA